jgi:DNA-binding MarR family transcriptional regulator
MKLEEEIAQHQFAGEQQKAMINLLFTYHWAVSKMKSDFKPYDITMQQFNILRILRGQMPNPCTINLLKERMLDKMCDASRMVDRLLQKGFIERCVNKKDRRAVDIKISTEGLALLAKFDELADPNKLFSKLSKLEAKTLNDLLDKVRS